MTVFQCKRAGRVALPFLIPLRRSYALELIQTGGPLVSEQERETFVPLSTRAGGEARHSNFGFPPKTGVFANWITSQVRSSV